MLVLPPRGVAVLIKQHHLARYTSEIGPHEEFEELAAIDGSHGFAQALVAGAQSSLHGMQTEGHAVDGIDDEAHLGVLSIVQPERLFF